MVEGGDIATAQAVAKKRGSSGAAAEGGSVAALPCSRVLRSEGRQRERDEREGREKGFGPGLTQIFLKISNGNMKNFQHESCSKFKILRLLL